MIFLREFVFIRSIIEFNLSTLVKPRQLFARHLIKKQQQNNVISMFLETISLQFRSDILTCFSFSADHHLELFHRSLPFSLFYSAMPDRNIKGCDIGYFF